MSKKLTVALFVFYILSFSAVTKANLVGTVNIAHSGMGAKSTMLVWGGGHNGKNVKAGALIINKTGDTGQGNLWENGNMGVFCIDLPQWASSNTRQYNLAMPEDGPVTNPLYSGTMGTKKADYLAELWGRFYDSDWVDGGSYSSQQNSDAEAFAAAIWEIIFEDLPSDSGNAWDVTTDGTAGNLGFRAKNLDWEKANSWLSQLDGSGPKADLRAFTNACHQDFLVEVPEPATLLLLGIGSLVFTSRKNKKEKA